VDSVAVFRTLTETERTSISNRSLKLFTLSSIYQGTKALLAKKRTDEVNADDRVLAATFWDEVSKHIPEWRMAAARKVTTSELRREYVHAHGLALHALGLLGSALLRDSPRNWKERLTALENIDWSRRNIKLWEGRALVAGRVSKANNNVYLTANYLKQAIGLTLSADDQILEAQLERNRP
jgi:DNA sulfur modification protein DndB